MDALPASVRHLFLLVAPIVLGWIGSDVIPVLKDRNPLVGSVVAAALVAIVAWVTPLTRQYGVGSADSSAHLDR